MPKMPEVKKQKEKVEESDEKPKEDKPVQKQLTSEPEKFILAKVSQVKSTKLTLNATETERFMHLNLKDFIKDEGCSIKPKELHVSITNWKEASVREVVVGYTNIPIRDSRVGCWSEPDFHRVVRSKDKVFDATFDGIKCVWTSREDADVDAKTFHSIASVEKKIKQADCEMADEVIMYKDEESQYSIGTLYFGVKRLYEGDIPLYIEISLLYEREEI